MLHLFHHTTALSIAWLAWRHPIGASWSGPFTNTFVHFFMYGYYALTEFGLPRSFGLMITPMQLVQFYFCLALAGLDAYMVFFYGSACGVNVYSLAYIVFCYLVFLIMFIRMFTEKKKLHTPRDDSKKKD
jgi:hypothetical protein